MGEFLGKMESVYAYLMDDIADFRTKDLPLIARPGILLLIVAVYLNFCLFLGPRLMKNRKAFELKTVIKYYNIFQILMSVFLVYEGSLYMLNKNYSLTCDPLINSTDASQLRTARNSWWYFFAKITELTETIFFVLRKKKRQVSTLHLYHHTMVVITAWMATKYFPIGPIVLVGTLNSLVHVLMYTYYFLSGLGPQYQKYLWWKKHMTLIQLIQFTIVIVHNVNAIIQDCNYPKLIHLLIITNTSILMYMFSKFYYHNYIKSKPKKTEEIKQKTKLKNGLNTKRKSISIGQ